MADKRDAYAQSQNCREKKSFRTLAHRKVMRSASLPSYWACMPKDIRTNKVICIEHLALKDSMDLSFQSLSQFSRKSWPTLAAELV